MRDHRQAFEARLCECEYPIEWIGVVRRQPHDFVSARLKM